MSERKPHALKDDPQDPEIPRMQGDAPDDLKITTFDVDYTELTKHRRNTGESVQEGVPRLLGEYASRPVEDIEV